MMRRGHRKLPLVFAALFLIAGVPAIPQASVDKNTYARNYVQFQVEQSDQWTKDFSHAFSQALVAIPASLDEPSKTSASDLRAAIQNLVSLSGSADVLTNPEFRKQLQQTLSYGSTVNRVFASQKVAEGLRADWVQIRATLNNLARVYRFEPLEPLGPPASAAKGTALAAAPPPDGKGVIGYVVDQQCAKRGKAMWTSVACIQRCIREGDKVVIVTEEGKVYQVANPDKIEADTYGQKVTVLGDVVGDTITVASLR
jgi:hypothetical protein